MATSRRRFVQSTAGLLAAGGAAGAPAPVKAPAAARQLSREDVEAEIRRRADHYLGQRRLVVDYYRIRRQLAYPLPVTSLSIPEMPVPGIPGYPWATWLTWELEERIDSLGWSAEWFGRQDCARAAARDLEALTAWPKYCQYPNPDLSSGHAARMLWTAYTKWRWPAEPLRKAIRAAAARHVEELVPLGDQYYGQLRTKEDFLALPEPHRKLPNIPLIGTAGAALTAQIAGHPAAAALNERLMAILGAIFELRPKGYAEAVAYDGYILDFVAPWLETLPDAQRRRILDHPSLRHYLEQAYMLAAPGALEQVAQLADVEPREMPFHYSAQARLAALQTDPVRSWYLRRWPVGWIRSGALGALRPVVAKLEGAAPPAGALNAHYANVLRTGWEKEDLAVAVSCTTSQASHLPPDNGTLVIGTRGRWIISDPGYQQYMRDAEREFTVGPTAHNYPVISGVMQDKKQPRMVTLDKAAPDLPRTAVELAACYPASAGVDSVLRTVWLSGRNGVVVADQVRSAANRKLDYHWHGHPDASWWARDGAVLVHLPDTDLWIATPQARLTDAGIVRHAGSRGQLTLGAEIFPAPPVVWWVFALGDAPPVIEPLQGGRGLRAMGREFLL